MRLITEKSKNEIGKRLAAIYYIAVHGYGNGTRNDLESTSKIIEHVHNIAYAVGGVRFSTVELPGYILRIEDRIRGEEHETCDNIRCLR